MTGRVADDRTRHLRTDNENEKSAPHMSAPRILIVGATGRIGRVLLRLLREDGIGVRVLVRTTEGRRDLSAAGVEAVIGDLRDGPALQRVLAGIENVFVVTRDCPEQADLEAKLFGAAATAGVEHIVKVSAFAAGLHPPVGYGVQHARSELALKDSGVHWTVLRPYMFMQNFLEMADLIARRGLIVFPGAAGRVSFIDARDVAAVARKVLGSPAYFGQIYELTGPEALGFVDCAAVFTSMLKRRVRYLSVPDLLSGLLMRAAGISRWDVRMRKELFRMLRADGEAGLTRAVQEITSAAPRSFSAFVKDHLHVFARS
ncbi:MAG: NmrA family NAD(P)-binding protein [Gammaproteobacteria bacterium]|nr:NmrA family NAD(P)-binding protein [Gammaproteobacteria bacterium]